MTPEAYITSGILELYVMGSLEPEEMANVEEMAHHHPEVLAAEHDVLQARASESSELLALIAKPDFRLVNLKGTEKHPEASALVAWNPGSAEVYLWANDLAQPGDDQQYQLWAIVDGQPQDAGVFDLGQGSLKMKDFGQAQTFAITLERKGGSPTPNLEQLHVIGTL